MFKNGHLIPTQTHHIRPRLHILVYPELRIILVHEEVYFHIVYQPFIYMFYKVKSENRSLYSYIKKN